MRLDITGDDQIVNVINAEKGDRATTGRTVGFSLAIDALVT